MRFKACQQNMDPVDPDSSIIDWLTEYPQLLPLFEEAGLDCSCGGRSLRGECQRADVSLAWILTQIEELQTSGPDDVRPGMPRL